MSASINNPEFVSVKLTTEQINSIVEKLGGYEKTLAFLQEEPQTTTINHIIDCNANPYIPMGLTVVEHKPGGLFEFDPSKIYLYLSEAQKSGVINGNNLRKLLADKPVLNANVLDYLLAHPEIIPEDWKGKYIFFWGTLYRYSNGNLFVRYLYWNGSKWSWSYGWLGDEFDVDCPAVLAS
ncbi:MAG: hypothetical protein PHR00_02085 [Patescibacteria group bacterium]|nr:hypothetical protein [Patescibacteria group bacterium]